MYYIIIVQQGMCVARSWHMAYRCIHTAQTQMVTIGCRSANLAFLGACQMIMSSTTTVATSDIPWTCIHPTVGKILQATALLQNLSQCLH